jgi:hypothetical protein
VSSTNGIAGKQTSSYPGAPLQKHSGTTSLRAHSQHVPKVASRLYFRLESG